MHKTELAIMGSLLLFESKTQDRLDTGAAPAATHNYSLQTEDTVILKDLIQRAIPSIETNGLFYVAKKEGKTYKIK
jgi:hypothetical protein